MVIRRFIMSQNISRGQESYMQHIQHWWICWYWSSCENRYSMITLSLPLTIGDRIQTLPHPQKPLVISKKPESWSLFCHQANGRPELIVFSHKSEANCSGSSPSKWHRVQPLHVLLLRCASCTDRRRTTLPLLPLTCYFTKNYFSKAKHQLRYLVASSRQHASPTSTSTEVFFYSSWLRSS